MAFKLQKEDKHNPANGDCSGKGDFADYGRGKKQKDPKRKVYFWQEDVYHKDNEQAKDDD